MAKNVLRKKAPSYVPVFFQNGKYSIFFHWYYLSVHSVKHLLLDRRQPSNYSWTLFFLKKKLSRNLRLLPFEKKSSMSKEEKEGHKNTFCSPTSKTTSQTHFWNYFEVLWNWIKVIECCCSWYVSRQMSLAFSLRPLLSTPSFGALAHHSKWGII